MKTLVCSISFLDRRVMIHLVRPEWRHDKKTPGGMPAGGLLIPGFFTRGRQA